jgi:hypothetical protein
MGPMAAYVPDKTARAEMMASRNMDPELLRKKALKTVVRIQTVPSWLLYQEKCGER